MIGTTYLVLDTTDYGKIPVSLVFDDRWRPRLVPYGASKTVEAWLHNQANSLPPTILPSDCCDPYDWQMAITCLFEAANNEGGEA